MNYRFSKKAIRKDAPNLSGVYLIYQSGAGMSHLDIYVGQTENILGSLLEHYEKKSDDPLAFGSMRLPTSPTK